MFVIADCHFSHKKILEYQQNRLFDSVDEMDDALIQVWNSIVADGDKVYHLGDFCLGNKERWESILSRLNGSIVLIKGNHDRIDIIKNMLETGCFC